MTITAKSSPRAPTGWGTRPVETTAGRATVVEALVDALAGLGVRDVFGIVGGGIAPFADAVARSDLALWHTRHESGAAFCATEAHFASGAPTAVFVTTGPGLTNAITGLTAARWDGAKVVLVSGWTGARQRGRWSVQETSVFTMPPAFFTPGALFDDAVVIRDGAELPAVVRRLAHGFGTPRGHVAHVALPLDLQTVDLPRLRPAASSWRPAGADPETISDCAHRLARGDVPIWVGFGARHASRDVVALAERTGARLMCSPRAKGVVPEDHPAFLGVTGVGGHDAVQSWMRRNRPRHILVLGSRLGEVTSGWSRELCPTEAMLQVDLDPRAFGAAYPDVATLGIQAEIGVFVRGLLAHLGGGQSQPVEAPVRPSPAVLNARSEGRVRPQFLMQILQRVVVDASSSVVMTESGNAFGWGNHLLRFDKPGRYRTSAAFGSMGHFVTGVVGAALARRGKAVAVVGDGAMLMNNEVSTAVRYQADAVWVVLNDALYGITNQAMSAQGFSPVETELPDTDFVAFARSMGADGERVAHEDALESAMLRAMAHRGPFVVDVRIDPDEINPVLASRVASLEAQGAIGRRESQR